MKFKSRQPRYGQIPEINLVPMMDVILAVLTFFIIISMTLTSQQGAINVTLPSVDAPVSKQTLPEPMIVGLDKNGQILLEDKLVSEAELSQQMKFYFTQQPEGSALLKADSELPYKQVVNLLGKMQYLGGDRVSLAIDKSQQ